jgi:hypothetical protein
MKSIDKARLEFIREVFLDRLISEDDLAEQYDEFLDEFGSIKIGVIQLWPSEVLKKMDPIAYNVGLHDYMSGMEEVLTGLYANAETYDEIYNAWDKLVDEPDSLGWAEVAMPPEVAKVGEYAGVHVYEHPEKGDESPLIVAIGDKAWLTDEFDKNSIFYALEVM